VLFLIDSNEVSVQCSFKILINMFVLAFVFYVRNFLFVQCQY